MAIAPRAGGAAGSLLASVIIPTRDGAARLPGLLQALQRQEVGGVWEVIVVEDGSSEIRPDLLQKLTRARLLLQPQRGPGSARNRGARLAQGQVLVFLDDDCLPEPDWLAQMLAPFAEPRVVGVKGAYATDQREVVASFVQAEYEQKYARLLRKPFVNFVDAYSAAFRRNVFLEAGGFDESFPLPSVEDREFSLRLSRGHGLMVFNPRAVVRHRHVASFSGYLAKKLKYGRFGVRILRRMPTQFVADDHTPHSQRLQVLLVGLLPGALFAAAALSPWVLGAWATAFWGSAVPLVWRSARRGRAVGLAAIPLVLLRAVGLAAGLAWGAVAPGSAAEGPAGHHQPERSAAPSDS